MASPSDCRFLESHEWHKLEGNIVTLGISEFAVHELTDITFVELPSVGDEVVAGKEIGEIESVKTTSELYSGVSGKIVEVNEGLEDNPGLINEDPFGAGWLVKIEVADASELDALMSSTKYDDLFS